MNFHNISHKNLFESYIAPTPVISRCFSSKANAFTNLPGNSLYLGSMRHFTKKNAPFGPGHLKMPPLEHRTEFCDPLVKIVGGFVGSKSQAGTANHRGREVSLWDVIVDKIIETMENPEPKQASRTNGKKNGKIHKIGSFTMIGVGSFGPESGSSFDCLSTNWFPASASELHNPDDFGNMGVFDSSNLSSGSSSGPSKNIETLAEELNYETDTAAFCKHIDRQADVLQVNSGSPSVSSLDSTALCTDASDCPPTKSESTEQVEGDSPCSIDHPRQNNLERTPSGAHFAFTPSNVLRPEAAEFTPRVPCQRASLESESEDDVLVDVLSSSCDSQTPADAFLRPQVQRTLSECSVDSDDSFIVFESAADDPVILSEDSEDEDSCSDDDLDEIDNPILITHNLDFSQPPPILSRLEEANKKWAESYSNVTSKPSTSTDKKVKFAEGNNLIKVKHLIAWDFAHRAARVGPWEMYHRDTERFKSRIAALSSVLSPVLAKRHREKIYSERFQT